MLQRIQKYVMQTYPDILQFLAHITAIDRGTKNIKGLNELADIMAAQLQKRGCVLTRYQDPIYGPLVIGRKQGKGKIRILLFAHMDTVWPDGTCLKRPFRIDGNRAYGPGVSDCSHGLIGSLFALDTLNALNIDSYGELIFLYNPDEELYSPFSEAYIAHNAKEVDLALCMEGADQRDEYITHRGGVLFYDIEVHGVKSHAGMAPELGRNAIEELCHKITLIHALKIPNAIFETTLIQGGISEGMIPGFASAHVDVRIDSMESIPLVHQAMSSIQQDILVPGTRSICWHRPGGCLPLIRTPALDPFCCLLNQVSREAGFPLHEAFCGGGANAVISAIQGIPTLDGLTPSTYACHTDNEYMDLTTIVPRIAILVEFIRRLSLDDQYLRAKPSSIPSN